MGYGVEIRALVVDDQYLRALRSLCHEILNGLIGRDGSHSRRAAGLDGRGDDRLISAWSQGLLIKRKTSPSLTEPTIAARSE